jgi:hypothetical protein
MKRIALSALGVILASAAIGLSGCDSGGIEPGLPTDQTQTVPAVDLSKMGNMAKMPKNAEESKKKNPDAGKVETPAEPEKK